MLGEVISLCARVSERVDGEGGGQVGSDSLLVTSCPGQGQWDVDIGDPLSITYIYNMCCHCVCIVWINCSGGQFAIIMLKIEAAGCYNRGCVIHDCMYYNRRPGRDCQYGGEGRGREGGRAQQKQLSVIVVK